jgi:hypothetical protein
MKKNLNFCRVRFPPRRSRRGNCRIRVNTILQMPTPIPRTGSEVFLLRAPVNASFFFFFFFFLLFCEVAKTLYVIIMMSTAHTYESPVKGSLGFSIIPV